MKRYVQKFSSTVLVLSTLLIGITLLPFVEASPVPLGWEQFIGVYESDLDVNENKGAPGSVFTFFGSSYPINSMAGIYIDGLPVGSVTTNTEGEATFLIDSTGLELGSHIVTMEVDSNATASKTIEIDDQEPVVPEPPNSEAPRFDISGVKYKYLPIVPKS